MKSFTPINDLIAGALRNALKCECSFCLHRPINQDLANRALEAFQRRLLSNQDCDALAIHALKMLVRAEAPILGADFDNNLRIDDRTRKEIMRSLRDDWLLPVCATRQRPFGYFIAATAEQFLEWMRVTRSQAISELATAHKLFRANFPELAGQESFDFVGMVSSELKAALDPITEPGAVRGPQADSPTGVQAATDQEVAA